MAVFVLDKHKKQLNPCSEKRAKELLDNNRAVIHKMYPFTIRLKDKLVDEIEVAKLKLKIDPGSKYTGFALVRNDNGKETAIFLGELKHRGMQISMALTSRRALRRSRRNRKTRYRPARFNNRTKPKGWLPPSLQHRIDTIMSWIKKLSKLANITEIEVEFVNFDTQKMENPEINGIEYQQGELEGYEVREYLLEKFNRSCIYCGKKDVPLQIEHIIPKSKGGSNKVSNLGLACEKCNQKKSSQSIEIFLKNDNNRLTKIKFQLKKSLKDSAAVNATKNKLAKTLEATNLKVSLFSGARTKYNRIRLNIPKTHALDAACIGNPKVIENWKQPTLLIKCIGRGRYQRTITDKYGFSRGYLMKEKSIHGFQSGDMVKAEIPKGKYAGSHFGRIAIRKSGCFSLKTKDNKPFSVNYGYCSLLQRADGYSYNTRIFNF